MKSWRDLDGERIVDVIGEFADYDGLIEGLRQRAAAVGLSYRSIDELANFGEGATGKYLADLRVKHFTVASLLRMTTVLGVKAVFVIDPEMAVAMAPEWGKRDARRAHARRLARVGKTTIVRLLPAVAGEYARRGGKARMASMTAEMRRRFASAGGRARWHKRALCPPP
jgi:hypothetical protein